VSATAAGARSPARRAAPGLPLRGGPGRLRAVHAGRTGGRGPGAGCVPHRL